MILLNLGKSKTSSIRSEQFPVDVFCGCFEFWYLVQILLKFLRQAFRWGCQMVNYLVPIYFHVWKLKLFHQSISMTWFLQRKDRTMVPSNNTKVKWRNRTKHIFTFFSFPKRYAMQYKVVCTFTEMQIWTKIWNYVQQKLGGDTYKLQIRREAAWMELYFMLGELHSEFIFLN